jgi:hypothetical protein
MRATLAREVNRKMMGKLLFGNLWAGLGMGAGGGLEFKVKGSKPKTLNLEH